MAVKRVASPSARAKLKKLEEENKSLVEKNKSLAEIIELSSDQQAIDPKAIEDAIELKMNDFKKNFSLLEKQISSQKKEPSVSPQQINDLSSKFATIEDRLKVLDRIPDLEKKITQSSEAVKTPEQKDGLFGDMGAFEEEASGSLFAKGSAPRSLRAVDMSLRKMDETTDARFRHFEKKLDDIAKRLSPSTIKSLEKMAQSGEEILHEIVPNEVKAEVDRIVNSFSFEVRGLSDTVRKLSQDTESINSETREYVEKLRATEGQMKAFKELAVQLKQDENFIDRMKMAERLKHDEIIIGKLKKELESIQKKASVERIQLLEERMDSLEPVSERIDQGELMVQNINAKTEQLEKRFVSAEKMNSIEKQVSSLKGMIGQLRTENINSVSGIKNELESISAEKTGATDKILAIEKRLKSYDKMAEKLIQNEASIETLTEDIKQHGKKTTTIDAVKALEARIGALDNLAGTLSNDVRQVKARVETGLGDSPLTKLFGIKDGKSILKSMDAMARRMDQEELVVKKLRHDVDEQIRARKPYVSEIKGFEIRMAEFEEMVETMKSGYMEYISGLKKAVAQIRKEKDTNIGRIASLEERASQIDILAKRLEQSEDLVSKLANNTGHNKELIGKIMADARIQEKKLAHVEKINAIEEQLKSLKIMAGQFKSDNTESVTGVREVLETLNTKKADDAKKFRALDARISSFENLNANLKSEATLAEKMKQDLSQALNKKANDAEVRSLEARLKYAEEIIGKLKSEDLKNTVGIKESIDKVKKTNDACMQNIKGLEERIESLGSIAGRIESGEQKLSKLDSNIEQINKNLPVQRIAGIEDQIKAIRVDSAQLSREIAQTKKDMNAGIETSVIGKVFGIKKGKEIAESAKKTAEEIERQKALIEKLKDYVEGLSKNKAAAEDLSVHESKIYALEELVGSINREDIKNISALKEELCALQAGENSHNEKIVGLEYRLESIEKAIRKANKVETANIEELKDDVDHLKKINKKSATRSFIKKLVSAKKERKANDAFEELEMLFRQGVISRESFEDGMKKLFPQEDEDWPSEAPAQYPGFRPTETDAVIVPQEEPLPDEGSGTEICHYRAYQRLPDEES